MLNALVCHYLFVFRSKGLITEVIEARRKIVEDDAEKSTRNEERGQEEKHNSHYLLTR